MVRADLAQKSTADRWVVGPADGPLRPHGVEGLSPVGGYDDGRTVPRSQAEQRAAEGRGRGPSPRPALHPHVGALVADAAPEADASPTCAPLPDFSSDPRWVRALQTGVTAWGWEHRDMESDAIGKAARGRMLWWLRHRRDWARSFRLRYGRAPSARAMVDSEAAIRAERRNMRRCTRQAREAYGLLRGHVGSRGHQAKHASRRARYDRRDQLEREREWMEAAMVVDTTTGEAIPLAKVARQPRQRRAELHVVTRGMIDYEIAQGRWPHFITLTLPATWHPAPKFGRAKWDGSLPVAGQRELRRRWALARARAKKAGIDLVGGRFVEPHSDGCVHWHQIQFLRDDAVQRVVDILTAVFGGLGPAVRIERARSAEGAAKYCMAYSAKTAACGDGEIGKHISGDDLEGVDAWRSTWGIRGWQLFGLKGRLGVWRELRRQLPPDAPAPIAQLAGLAKTGKFREFHEAAETAGARLATVTEQREFPHPDPEVHTELEVGQAEAARRLRGLAAENGVPVGADTPPADLIEPLLAHAGDDAETVREIREAESALTRRAVVAVTRRRTVGVHLDAHGVCVTTRTRHWVLVRAEDSAAASAAALAASGITVTADPGSKRARTGEISAAQAPPGAL